jgi:2-polyprenyl-6-hydroxyphenyl methylase/3-demethylubiquinone-9 3-methyltransferase
MARKAMDKTTLRPVTRDAGTADPEEVARFAAMAEEWWDPAGKFRPIHKLNPVRVGFIRDRVAAHFDRDAADLRVLKGLSIVDIGCGGGVLAEPLARLGADVVGIDAAERSVEIARLHAANAGLDIDYRHSTPEDLAAAGERFDVVLSMEVVEHVADVGAFVAACGALAKPGGLAILATLNRTPKSWLFAIVGAEYVLRWLPVGTHEWRKFVRPSELAGALRHAGLQVRESTGVTYDPLRDAWRLAPRDLDVNYMMLAERPA